MIDEKTAVDWAINAGFKFWSDEHDCFEGEITEIQALITRAQNEAYERAASTCNAMLQPTSEYKNYKSWCAGTNDAAERIRALKQEPPK